MTEGGLAALAAFLVVALLLQGYFLYVNLQRIVSLNKILDRLHERNLYLCEFKRWIYGRLEKDGHVLQIHTEQEWGELSADTVRHADGSHGAQLGNAQ